MLIQMHLLQELKERVLKGKFSVPFYVPSDLQRLIKKFLVLNPAKRITLEVLAHYVRTSLFSGSEHCLCSHKLLLVHSVGRCNE